MGEQICPDCGQPTGSSAGPQPPSSPKGSDVAHSTAEAALPVVRPHWMDCQSEKAFHRRVRAGIEAGYVPITFSRIKRWKECAYGEQQENRIPDRIRGKSDKADVGTAIHAVLEADARGQSPDLVVLAKLIPMESRQDYEFFLRSARKFAVEETRLHALFLEDDARFWWEFPVTLENGTVVIAQVETKMDVLKIFTTEKLAEVVDYKTGRVVSETVDDDPQGKLYCAVISENEIGKDLEWFDFIQPQLRFWKPGPTARWSRREIEEFKVLFKMDVEAYVREKKFDTRPGNHCHWCPVAWRCPEGQKLLKQKVTGVSIQVIKTKESTRVIETASEVVPQVIEASVQVTNEDQARELALTVIQMKAAVQQIDGWLKEYVKQTGENIDLDDGTNYGSQIKSSLRLPPEAYDAAREILAKHGFNFDDYVRWDMSEGDGWKFLKGRRGPEAGLLTDLAKPETYSRWEQSKKDG